MIHRTAHSHSIPEKEFIELIDKDEVRFKAARAALGESERRTLDKKLDSFFVSESKFLIAKKSPIYIKQSEIGVFPAGIAWYAVSKMTRGTPDDFFRVGYTIGIGPSLLGEYSPFDKSKDELSRIIEKKFDIFSCDHTWIDEKEKSPEEEEEMMKQTKESVEFFLDDINPLRLEELLLRLAQDLKESFSKELK